MRVAFFVNWFPVASEAFIMTSAAALKDAGCSVDIYSLEGAAPALRERPGILDSHGLEEQSYVCAAPPKGRLLQAPAALARAVSRTGVGGLRALDPIAHRRRALSLAPIFEAAEFRRGGNYDVLHVQFSTLAPIVLRHRRAGALKGAVVVHFRGYDISQRVREYGETLHAEAFAEADYFVANCRFFQDRVLQLGSDPARTCVVPSGVDPDKFPYREREAPTDRAVRLLCVGRLVPKKGFLFAVRAAGRLVAEGIPLRLHIVGEGPERPRLEAEIRQLGLRERVQLLGEASSETIARELNEADIFLAPCMTDENGAQDAPVNVLKEAMLAGTPVVSTLHGGIPELVEHAVTGMMTPEGDDVGIAAAVKTLLSAPGGWCKMTREARAVVERSYSHRVSRDATLEAYRRAIEHYRH